jgi:hypothetical protein
MMPTRRQFIIGAAALGLLPLGRAARAMIDYTPGLVTERLAAGETVFDLPGARTRHHGLACGQPCL